MDILLGVALGLTWLACGGAVLFHMLRPKIDPIPTAPEPNGTAGRWEATSSALETLTVRVDNLTLAVSDGIARVDRAEKRIQKTVTSARRLVREAYLEHAGIEAEYDELEPPDDLGVEPLPALPEEVESTASVRVPGGSISLER